MATIVVVDDALLEEALRVGGSMTEPDTITRALQEFIMRRRESKGLELEGQIDFDPDYDYKEQRRQS